MLEPRAREAQRDCPPDGKRTHERRERGARARGERERTDLHVRAGRRRARRGIDQSRSHERCEGPRDERRDEHGRRERERRRELVGARQIAFAAGAREAMRRRLERFVAHVTGRRAPSPE